jgi:peptide deformylase
MADSSWCYRLFAIGYLQRIMAIRQILPVSNPLLRQKAQKVKRFDGSLQKLVDDLVETMHAAHGLGLAAPQIGEALQVIVVWLPPEEDEEGRVVRGEKLYALVNPEIVKTSPETVVGEEGCLCLPHYYGQVRRAAAVIVKGRNPQGKEVKVKANGLLARALQHEVDHLHGVLFLDRLESLESLHYVEPQQGVQEPGL